MWFIVLALTPVNDPAMTSAFSHSRFATYSGCMAAAAMRSEPLTRMGMHGRYMCMYHREPDQELAATVKRAF